MNEIQQLLEDARNIDLSELDKYRFEEGDYAGWVIPAQVDEEVNIERVQDADIASEYVWDSLVPSLGITRIFSNTSPLDFSHGYINQLTGEMWVEQSLPGYSRLGTLFHELTHFLRIKDGIRINVENATLEEIVAQATSYAVLSALGFDSSNYTKLYIRGVLEINELRKSDFIFYLFYDTFTTEQLFEMALPIVEEYTEKILGLLNT